MTIKQEGIRSEIVERIKIYGTFGPSCHKKETLKDMIEAGMTGIRLNLSHTSLYDSREWIENLKAASLETGKRIDLAIDVAGPELRIGKIDGNKKIKEGDIIYLRGESGDFFDNSPEDIIIPDCLAQKLEVGQEVSINDGMIQLIVDKVEEKNTKKRAVCTAKTSGEISSRKSISIRGIRVDNPVLTIKDIENLKAARQYGVTEIMLPFVRSEKDIEEVRKILDDMNLEHIKILAKIEHQEGVENIDCIIGNADCIVIARGDLGNRYPIWKVPGIQKMISKKCTERNQKFMVVTQMLNSMIQNPTPTRAEVLDIYNAVLDGASSLMVTGETAVGAYPVEVIKYMKYVMDEAVVIICR